MAKLRSGSSGKLQLVLLLFSGMHVSVKTQVVHYIIADTGNHRVQKCPALSAGSECTTVAGSGSGQSGDGVTELSSPHDVAIDGSGDYIIADYDNHRVQKCPALSPGSACATVAGTGQRGSGPAELAGPTFVSIDDDGDYLISDEGNHRVLKCPATSPGSPCTMVAGTGQDGLGLIDNAFGYPAGVAIDEAGAYIITDAKNGNVRKCPPDGSRCVRVYGYIMSGSDSFSFDYPGGITIDSSGDFIIADEGNHRVQKCRVAWPGSSCMTVAGTGTAGCGSTQLNLPVSVSLDSNGDYLISDQDCHRVQRCPAASPGSACTTIAGTGSEGSTSTEFRYPRSVEVVVTPTTVVATTASPTTVVTTTASPTTVITTTASRPPSGTADFAQKNGVMSIVVMGLATVVMMR